MSRASLLLIVTVFFFGCESVVPGRVFEREAEGEIASVEIIRIKTPTDREFVFFAPGGRISTDSESIAVIRYADGSAAYAAPNSVLRIGSIFVEFGEVSAKVAAKVKGLFGIDTEFVKAVASGTEFVMRVKGDDLTVTVLQDRVRCISKRLRWSEFVLETQDRANFQGQEFPLISRASDDEVARLRRRLAQMEKIAAPLPPEQQGWCCFSGTTLQASAGKCESLRGRFSLDQNYLDEVCRPAGAASPAKPPSAVEKRQVVEDVVSLNEIFDEVINYNNRSLKTLEAENPKAAQQELEKARQAFAKAQAPFASLAANKDRQGFQKIYELAQDMRDMQNRMLMLVESMIAQYQNRDVAVYNTQAKYNQLRDSYNEKRKQINVAMNEIR
ncbi:MAG: FecR domain-containing protein [Burkholderiales bacterium]